MTSLSRLLDSGKLEFLEMCSEHVMPTPEFYDALRSSRLHVLQLAFAGRVLFDNLVPVLDALIGHSTLNCLDLSHFRFRTTTTLFALVHIDYGCNDINLANLLPIGAALGRLVGANSALTALDVSECKLGDAGLSPLVDALPGNTRLQRLSCGHNGVTPALEARLAAIRCTINTLLK